MQLMKNHNFRRHIAEHGVQNHENGMGTYAAVLLGSHFTPSPCFRTLYLDLPIKKCRKTMITQKVLITQSSNIVHCNWHTQKPMCADLQAFANTFSLCKLTFFSFLSGGVQETAKISHFVDFDWEKCIQNGLSGTYLGFEACQIQCCSFWVSAISSSWKITISAKINILIGKNALKLLAVVHIPGFKACWIQWHLLRVSMISGSSQF